MCRAVRGQSAEHSLDKKAFFLGKIRQVMVDKISFSFYCGNLAVNQKALLETWSVNVKNTTFTERLALLKQRRMMRHVEASRHELGEIKRSATSLVGYHAYVKRERIKFARFNVTGEMSFELGETFFFALF